MNKKNDHRYLSRNLTMVGGSAFWLRVTGALDKLVDILPEAGEDE